jgi:hypothetical protein
MHFVKFFPTAISGTAQGRTATQSTMTVLLVLFSCSLLPAQAPDFKTGGWSPLLNGRDLEGWTSRDRKPHTWSAQDGPAISNGPSGRTADLLTTRRFGDIELYLEFMIPKKSNSGVYVHGLYEVQILDSFGVTTPGVHDCGAIYERWINGKGVGGSAPKRNASRAPGEWQSFLIRFRAPRFDSSGNKTENGRFLSVFHNGILVQENVEVEGPTRASLEVPEAPEGPVMIQGDHGPVMLRNIYVRPLKLR